MHFTLPVLLVLDVLSYVLGESPTFVNVVAALLYEDNEGIFIHLEGVGEILVFHGQVEVRDSAQLESRLFVDIVLFVVAFALGAVLLAMLAVVCADHYDHSVRLIFKLIEALTRLDHVVPELRGELLDRPLLVLRVYHGNASSPKNKNRQNHLSDGESVNEEPHQFNIIFINF
jgi:hypothetical protein